MGLLTFCTNAPAMRQWAVTLEAKQKHVVSSTRTDFPWTNSHHVAGDLRTGVQKLKDATPATPCTNPGSPVRDGSNWSRRTRSVTARSPCTTGARAR